MQIVVIIALLALSASLKGAEPLYPSWPDADFLKTASIYEMNVRQFSEAGTLAAAGAQLPRLNDLGVDIIWLMPIQPIGKKNRKGPLGSYYSISDYTRVNPEYGALEDLKQFVAEAHGHGMIVILDWVANHTAWDHPWINRHPDWYTRNAAGEVIDPVDPRTGESWGWTDVADLNYDNRQLWQAMTDAMVFWLREADIDGFRCDVAGEVPLAFWQFARPQLDRVKPVFMLAEAEKPALQDVFDMSYGWAAHHIGNRVAAGELPPTAFGGYMEERSRRFRKEHIMMMFTTNHDENSWNGTVFERYGAAHKAFAVLTFTLDGMPLIYSGQEAGMDRRLKFFEKDSIPWRDYPLQAFYRDLLTLKEQNPALWNGAYGGDFEALEYRTGNDRAYAFKRAKGKAQTLVAVNLSADPARLEFGGEQLEVYLKVYGDGGVADNAITLGAYQSVVLSRQGMAAP